MKQKKLSILIIGIVGILIISGLSTAIIKTEDKNSVSIDNISAKDANGVPVVGDAGELVLYVDGDAVSIDESAPSPIIGEAKEFKVEVFDQDGAYVEAYIRFCKELDVYDEDEGSTVYFMAPFGSIVCELHATACGYESFDGYIYVEDRSLSLKITEPGSALSIVEGVSFNVAVEDQDGEAPPGVVTATLYNDAESLSFDYEIYGGAGSIVAPDVEKDVVFNLKVWKDEGEYDEGEGPSITVLDNYFALSVYRADDYQDNPDNAEEITKINELEEITIELKDIEGNCPNVLIHFEPYLFTHINPATFQAPDVDKDEDYDIWTYKDGNKIITEIEVLYVPEKEMSIDVNPGTVDEGETFTVTVKDLSPATFTAPPVDEEESPRTYTITAKATGYNDAPGEIEVLNKDTPEKKMSIYVSPGTVDEGETFTVTVKEDSDTKDEIIG